MRKARWLAAVLAVGLLIPFCEQMRPGAKPVASVAAGVDGGARTSATTTRPPTTATATTTTTTTTTATATATTAPTTTTPPSTFAFTPTDAGARADTRADAERLAAVTSDKWAQGKFAGFTRGEAEEMVERCELRWQMPRAPSEKYAEAVRALYGELTGDEARVPLRAMADALRIGSDDEPVAVHRRLAEKRAGAGGEGGAGVYERFMQLQLDESERAARDGDALGAKFTLTGCDAEHALYRSTR